MSEKDQDKQSTKANSTGEKVHNDDPKNSKSEQTQSDNASSEEASSNSSHHDKKHGANKKIEPAVADSAFNDTDPFYDKPAKDNGRKPRKTPPGNNNKKSSSATKSIKWFIFIIIIAAIAYAIYFGWQKWQDYQANMQKADKIEQLEQAFKQQNHNDQLAQDKQNQKLNSLSSELQQNQSYIGQLQDQLRTTQRKIQAQNSSQQQEWIFNEAEYLIREASYKLSFTEDAASIVALLQAADKQLAELNDGSLTQVRQALSQDISAVRGSGNLDIEGIAIAIETLKQSLSELKLASVQLDKTTPQEDKPVGNTDISSWQHFKGSLSNAASKYYTVHHFDESAQPFISPQKDRLLRENILLNLQTAQLAALQHNNGLYQANLQQVKSWVTQYFKQKPANTQAFLQQLDELLVASVELDLPQHLTSYQLIKKISQQKVNRWLDEPESSSTDDNTQQNNSQDGNSGNEEVPSA